MARGTDDKQPFISIIIPVYNEEKNIAPLYEKLDSTLKKINYSYEVILVDDGSTDDSYGELLKVHDNDSRYRLIKFRRNFGQTAAISAGFDYSRGEIIITLDADLQNDPADIPKLVDEINNGYDIVSGWRKNRKEKFLSRRFPSMMANRLISKLTGVNIHDFGCTLKAYRKDVIKNVRLYGEMHRYIPAVASWMGVKVSEITVGHNARKHGKSKYGLNRVFKVFLDIITLKFLLSFSTKPIHVFGLLGLIVGGAGTILTLYLLVMRIFFMVSLGNRPLFIIAIFLIFIGIQFITFGLLAEINIRVYHESQEKPIYYIREIRD
ncbi:MAG: glycosyltransferase family 2 protein [Actinobacteria bacterium]|nr:glycosyltransferase family 2 protein [Actinomycetota bacterium]